MPIVEIEFGVMPEKQAQEIDECLTSFLERAINNKLQDGFHYGPITYIGILKHVITLERTLCVSAWHSFADNLFFLVDEFLRECELPISYKRRDTR